MSVTEALRHAGWAHGRSIVIRWVDSEALTPENYASAWPARPALSCPGGFGHRGIEGKVLGRALRARAQGARTWACAWACSAA